ncbi:MAG: hypothetical protein U1F34_05460 [Gammaproteobacteria bacterium]
MAAENGSVDAQRNLGTMYYSRLWCATGQWPGLRLVLRGFEEWQHAG